MELFINEDKNAIYNLNNVDYVICNAQKIGSYIELKTIDNELFLIDYSEKVMDILKDAIPEIFI